MLILAREIHASSADLELTEDLHGVYSRHQCQRLHIGTALIRILRGHKQIVAFHDEAATRSTMETQETDENNERSREKKRMVDAYALKLARGLM